MGRSTTTRAGAVLLVAVLGIALTAGAFAQENVIEVVVSPNVLNLESNGGSVSLHTNIRYTWVTDVELEIEGYLPEIYTFADNRGDLVVKCNIETVKSIVSEGEATFELTVYTEGGTYFGTDTINVINRGK